MGSGDVEPEKSGKEDIADRCGAGSEKNAEVGDAGRQWWREQAGLRHLGYGPAEEMEYGSDCTYLSTATIRFLEIGATFLETQGNDLCVLFRVTLFWYICHGEPCSV